MIGPSEGNSRRVLLVSSAHVCSYIPAKNGKLPAVLNDKSRAAEWVLLGMKSMIEQGNIATGDLTYPTRA